VHEWVRGIGGKPIAVSNSSHTEGHNLKTTNMELNIRITGSGTANEIAGALRQIAQDLEEGGHINAINERGETSWEDSALMTTITEAVL
jgi:hypothetical protein